jgi:hypothetical protein
MPQKRWITSWKPCNRPISLSIESLTKAAWIYYSWRTFDAWECRKPALRLYIPIHGWKELSWVVYLNPRYHYLWGSKHGYHQQQKAGQDFGLVSHPHIFD